tara:strand:- start:183 stop:401 length:219 start_codon:yes stop_codon:yes gene_type:complete
VVKAKKAKGENIKPGDVENDMLNARITVNNGLIAAHCEPPGDGREETCAKLRADNEGLEVEKLMRPLEESED